MRKEEMSVIVKTIASILFPIAMIFSFYVIMHGHLTPGGGFQGGAIGASAIALLVVAFGVRYVEKRGSEEKISSFESIGGIIFVFVALLGIFVSMSFLTNFLVGKEIFGKIPSWGEAPLNSGGILPILNIAVGMKVIGGLASVLMIIAFAAKEVEE
ncbi:MAG: MnhB domain-containing protein [Candidatus Thermoplasmatota archaeon]